MLKLEHVSGGYEEQPVIQDISFPFPGANSLAF